MDVWRVGGLVGTADGIFDTGAGGGGIACAVLGLLGTGAAGTLLPTPNTDFTSLADDFKNPKRPANPLGFADEAHFGRQYRQRDEAQLKIHTRTGT